MHNKQSGSSSGQSRWRSIGLAGACCAALLAQPAWHNGSHGAASAEEQAGQKPATPTPAAPAAAECRRATGQITIDGVADEPAWKQAQLLDHFTAAWNKQPGRSSTRARLLWDDEFLYFAAEMEDADLYADVTEHDGETWLNDVFELFFKPHEDRTGYYEFQVTPINTTMEMYLPSRGSGGFRRWGKGRRFFWETAVKVRGEINAPEEAAASGEGWSAEGRIPWKDFAPSGGRPQPGASWRFALCRYDYSKRFETPDLTTTSPLTRADFHRYEDYGPLKFVGAK